MNFKNLKLRNKLLIGFGGLLLLSLAIGFIAFQKSNTYAQISEDCMYNLNITRFLLEKQTDHLKWAGKVADLFLNNENELNVQIDGTKCAFGKWYYEFTRSADFAKLPDNIKSTLLSVEEPHRKLHDSAKLIKQQWEQNNAGVYKKCLSIYREDSQVLLAAIMEKFNEVFSQFDEHNAKLKENKDKSLASMRVSIITILISAIILGVFLACFTAGLIAKPLNKIVANLKILANAEGDLTKRIELNQADEMGDLAKYVNKVLDIFGEIVRNIMETAKEVGSGCEQVGLNSGKILDGSEQLASSAQETSSAVMEIHRSIQEVLKSVDLQTSSVTETSSSVEEMSRNIKQVFSNIQSQASAVNESTAAVEKMVSSIKQIAQNSDKVTEIAKETSRKADEGSEAVKETVNGMQEIATSSDKINNIIGVITGIASQTNLLALNAAIEAARAGDAGKGFAVVADEVRNLAEQSAQAAKEITSLIKDANAKAQKGVQLTQRVDSVIGDMIGAVSNVGQLIEEVNVSANEQKKGAEEIAEAMENVNRITQQTLASMEEQEKGTQEISKAMQDLAKVSEEINAAMNEQASGSEQISKSVDEVSRVAGENESGAKQSVTVADNLIQQSRKLNSIVNKFKI